jgi:hypothetical protein
MDLSEAFPTLYRYDQNQPATGWVAHTATTGSLNVGQGYAANFGASATPDTIDMSGEVNNGPVSFSGLYNHNHTYTQGFNLIGNPYPSPIDWNAAGWVRTNVDNAVYYFDNGTTNRYTGSYSSYINGISSNGIANNIIPAMQGFFVHVSNGSYPVAATLSVNNSARVNNLNPTYHKTAGSDVPLVRLQATYEGEGDLADATVVYMEDRTSLNYDAERDALKMLNTDERVPNLYSLAGNNHKLSISAIPAPGDSIRMIPLGVEASRTGNMTFKAVAVENLPIGLNVFLTDRKTGASQNIRQQPEYRAQLDSGVTEDRFFLVFSTQSTAHLPGGQDELMAYAAGADLFVYVASRGGEVTVTNTLGQIVQRQYISGTGYHRFHIDAPTGVYIATLTTPTTRQSKKVFLGTP